MLCNWFSSVIQRQFWISQNLCPHFLSNDLALHFLEKIETRNLLPTCYWVHKPICFLSSLLLELSLLLSKAGLPTLCSKCPSSLFIKDFLSILSSLLPASPNPSSLLSHYCSSAYKHAFVLPLWKQIKFKKKLPQLYLDPSPPSSYCCLILLPFSATLPKSWQHFLYLLLYPIYFFKFP